MEFVSVNNPTKFIILDGQGNSIAYKIPKGAQLVCFPNLEPAEQIIESEVVDGGKGYRVMISYRPLERILENDAQAGGLKERAPR